MSADRLTVLQVSPADIGGGAEKVAFDLHRQYVERGMDSWLAVGRKLSADEQVLEIPDDPNPSRWKSGLLGLAQSSPSEGTLSGSRWAIDRALRTAADPAHMVRIQRGLENFDFPGTALLPTLPPTRPSVLHLHNLHGEYFDIRALPPLTEQQPTILTMHDVWPLTGHCAYPLTCERWRVGCGDCPDLALPIPIRRDASEENCRIKRDALSAGGRLRVATPSRWLMRLVEESGLADSLAETRVIPNGVDTDVFRPGNRAEARDRLGLPQDATIVLFSARSAKSSPFKGFETLEAALPLIEHASSASPNLLLLALGEESPDIDAGGVPISFRPFAEDARTVALYNQAADLYIHPARAESFGLSVAEAMACGIPVVASGVGGIPEVVLHRETGLIFSDGDVVQLAQSVKALLGDARMRGRMGEAGRSRVGSQFTLDRQVETYYAWYRHLAEPSRGDQPTRRTPLSAT